MVLEKTLESPLDCKEIQPVHPKGNQSWMFIGRTDVEAETPNYLILCHPCLLLPSIFPSIRGFSNESVLRIRWPKYWSFSFSISLSNEYSGLISFRIDWFDLQGTLKSVLQYHSSKASILWCSAFFMVQLYIDTWLLAKSCIWLYGPLLAK